MLGKSLDNAVVIDIREGNYVHAEYVWLADNIGEYEFVKQELKAANEKFYDKITVKVRRNGAEVLEDYYFDCTAGFIAMLENFDK